MACHRRVTFYFAIGFSVLAMTCLFAEIIPPGMIRDEFSCFGMIFDCEECPKSMTIGDYSNCDRTADGYWDAERPTFFASLILASIACGLITVFTVVALIIGAILYCVFFDWRRYLPPFEVAFMIVVVISMMCNTMALSFWSIVLPEGLSYYFSFYLGWIANGILLILFILLLFIRVCGSEADNNKIKSDPIEDDWTIKASYSVRF